MGKLIHNLGSYKAIQYTATGLRGLALATFSQSISAPSPNAMAAEFDDNKIRGIVRITRHALFTSLAFWGLANVIARGYAVDLLFWAPYARLDLVLGWNTLF